MSDKNSKISHDMRIYKEFSYENQIHDYCSKDLDILKIHEKIHSFLH